MRILSITAGAAGMYCGSCTRDNALARELMALGHDVTLLPVYTPTRPDEANVSRPRVLFGGISVYLQQYAPMFRKAPPWLDRLWDAPGVISAFASRALSTDGRMLGDLTVSMLQGEHGALRREFDKLVDWIRAEPLPDVINLPNTLLIAMAGPLKREFNRPVCCTMQGEEFFLDSLVPPYRDQALALIREQVLHVDRFIAVGDYCAAFMSDYLEIPRERVSVVPLGINMDGYPESSPAASRPEGEPLRIGYFARIAPEKGLHVLADAYIGLRRRTGRLPIRLETAGYLARSERAYFDGVCKTLDGAGLAHECTHHGEVSREGKLAYLQRLDVLSVPTTFDEPKGMFVLEAMASGVPVVQPRRGGFTEIVERTGGGLLVERDDTDALTEGLQTLVGDAALRVSLADRAFHGVREHHGIAESAARLLDVFASVVVPGESAANTAANTVANTEASSSVA
jgi:glycosyltransferase involved in cell wall biosynthesis